MSEGSYHRTRGGDVAVPEGVLAVKSDAPAGGDGSTWGKAFNSIVDAFAAASEGTQIWLCGHFYEGAQINLNNAGLTTVEFYGGFAGTEETLEERDWNNNVTIIDGNDTHRILYWYGASGQTRKFYGITFQNGYSDKGGAMYNRNYGQPYFYDCIFDGNEATADGGAFWREDPRSQKYDRFYRCIMRNNVAANRGAVYRVESLGEPSAHIADCLMYDNTCEGGNAGAIVYMRGNFRGNTVIDNTSGTGSAIYGFYSNFRNCIIRGHTSNLALGAGSSCTYSNIEGGMAGTGNIDADPLFVNQSEDNYRLTDSSPCRNTGGDYSRSLDLDNNPGEVGTIDMGCYENQTV